MTNNVSGSASQVDGPLQVYAGTNPNSTQLQFVNGDHSNPTVVASMTATSTGVAYSTHQQDSNAAITASTTHTQNGATKITTDLVSVTVANASDSVVLPASAVGYSITVANTSATLACQVYASGSDTINGTAGSTGVALAATTVTIYFCFVAGAWLSK